MAVTIARYLTPSGQDINGVGITPNAALPAAAAAAGTDGPVDTADAALPTSPAGFCSAISADEGRVGWALLDAATHPPAAKPSFVLEDVVINK